MNASYVKPGMILQLRMPHEIAVNHNNSEIFEWIYCGDKVVVVDLYKGEIEVMYKQQRKQLFINTSAYVTFWEKWKLVATT